MPFLRISQYMLPLNYIQNPWGFAHWNPFWSSGNSSVRLRMQSCTLHTRTWISHFCCVSARSKAVRWRWCLFKDSCWNLSQQSSSGYAVRFLCALIFFKLLCSVKNNTVNTVLLFLNSGVTQFAAINWILVQQASKRNISLLQTMLEVS